MQWQSVRTRPLVNPNAVAPASEGVQATRPPHVPVAALVPSSVDSSHDYTDDVPPGIVLQSRTVVKQPRTTSRGVLPSSAPSQQYYTSTRDRAQVGRRE